MTSDERGKTREWASDQSREAVAVRPPFLAVVASFGWLVVGMAAGLFILFVLVPLLWIGSSVRGKL